jgi:hypothetical protein
MRRDHARDCVTQAAARHRRNLYNLYKFYGCCVELVEVVEVVELVEPLLEESLPRVLKEGAVIPTHAPNTANPNLGRRLDAVILKQSREHVLGHP